MDAIAEEPAPELRAFSIGTTLSDIVSERHQAANAKALIPVTLYDPRAASAGDDLKGDASTS